MSKSVSVCEREKRVCVCVCVCERDLEASSSPSCHCSCQRMATLISSSETRMACCTSRLLCSVMFCRIMSAASLLITLWLLLATVRG